LELVGKHVAVIPFGITLCDTFVLSGMSTSTEPRTIFQGLVYPCDFKDPGLGSETSSLWNMHV
jgi:hypothetical protein